MKSLRTDTLGRTYMLIPKEDTSVADEVLVYDPTKDEGKIITVCKNDGNK